MWNQLQQSPFFIQFAENTRFSILITDFIKIWEVYYAEEEFLSCIKESNFGLELDTRELLQNGTKLLQTPQQIKKLTIQHNDATLDVTMSMFFGYSFKLKINLSEGPRELFFQKVVQPALKTIQDLRSSESELRTLLTKKDEEISDYIQSLGTKIRYTTLPVYKDEAHMERHTTYSQHFGVSDIPNALLERMVQIPEKNGIKEENDTKERIKLELASQEHTVEPATNRQMLVKQESVKTENPPVKRRKKLNI